MRTSRSSGFGRRRHTVALAGAVALLAALGGPVAKAKRREAASFAELHAPKAAATEVPVRTGKLAGPSPGGKRTGP